MMAMKLVDANHWAVEAEMVVFISFQWWFLLQIGLQQSPIPHHALLSWGSLVTSSCLFHVNVLMLSLHCLCDTCNQSNSVMLKELSEIDITEKIVTIIIHQHFSQEGLSSNKTSYIFLSLILSTVPKSRFTLSLLCLMYLSFLVSPPCWSPQWSFIHHLYFYALKNILLFTNFSCRDAVFSNA